MLDKGYGNEIDPYIQTELQIFQVFRRQAGNVQFGARQVDSFMRLKVTAQDNFGVNVFAIQFENLKFQLTIIQEDVISGNQRFVQFGDVEGNENGAFAYTGGILGRAQRHNLV